MQLPTAEANTPAPVFTVGQLVTVTTGERIHTCYQGIGGTVQQVSIAGGTRVAFHPSELDARRVQHPDMSETLWFFPRELSPA